jgi:hypothetical protein
METYEGVVVNIHEILTSKLPGAKWSDSLSGRFSRDTHLKQDSEGPSRN